MENRLPKNWRSNTKRSKAMKKIQFVAIVILCMGSINSLAQTAKLKKSEFAISSFGGLAGLSSSLPNGNVKPEIGYQFALDWKYFFSPKWGIGLGVGYSAYSSKANLDSYSLKKTPSIDDTGEGFEYHLTASGIKEKLKLSAIETPFYLAYRKEIPEKLGLQGSFGFKVSLPITATYQATEGTIETTGYYWTYDVVFSNMPNHGFEKIEKIGYSGDLTTKMAYSLFCGFAISKPIGKVGLTIGVYGSYGLSSVLQPGNKQLVTYPSIYNSLTSLSKKVNLVAVGLKLGVSF